MEHQRIELSDIALFVEVAKRRSFSRAAEALHMPNSSLSRRISRLEQAVGVVLLRRSSRAVDLTEPGRRYFERCQEIVLQAEAAHEQLALDNVALKGRIRMSVPVDFGLLFIAPVLADFSRDHPDLEFDVDMTPRRVDLVADSFDVAIRVGEVDDSATLVMRRLATVDVSLYAAPSYLLAAGVPSSPADLERHSCLRMLLGVSDTPWVLHRGSEEARVTGRSRFRINNLSMLRKLTLAGAGIGAFDAVIASTDVQSGHLQRVLPDWPMAPLPISALTAGRRMPRRVRVWIDYLAERLRCFDCAAP